MIVAFPPTRGVPGRGRPVPIRRAPLGTFQAAVALASAFVLFVSLKSSAAVTSVDKLQLPSTYPRLLLNSNGVAELKQRVADAPWAKKAWAELEKNAAQNLSKPVQLPPRGGNWSHNYVCPTHGARLSRGKQLGDWQWEHFCPEGNHRP